MSRRQSFHEDPIAYLNVMREAFAGHYAAWTDAWSQDDSLLEAARSHGLFPDLVFRYTGFCVVWHV